LYHQQIFGGQSKFPLLAVDGVVLGVVDGVVLGVFCGRAELCSGTVHVLFAHTSGGGDPKTAGFVEMS